MTDDLILQVGVKILLQNSEGKYLLLRRSREKYPEIDKKWDITGGRIIPGTTLMENLKREIKEETTLDLIGEPKLIHAQDILHKGDCHVVRLTYLGRGEGEVVLDADEHDSYKWCSMEELTGMEDIDEYLKELLMVLNYETEKT